MASWWSGRRSRAAVIALLLVAIGVAGMPSLASAQAVSATERDALFRLANDVRTKGLPSAPLTSKIQEGLAKGVAAPRIEAVVRQMTEQLVVADRLVRETEPALAIAERETSVTLLAEAFAGGVTEDEVRELRRASQAPGMPVVSIDGLVSAARALSFIKDAQLPAVEGASVMVAALQRGYRPHEMVDLGRQVKRREADYRSGRASLTVLREAIIRGERPDQLFRDGRPATAERPAPIRPDPARPEPARPETPQRPERPVRPERSASGR